MKIKLLGKNLEELKALAIEEGLPAYTAKQIARWLYVRKVSSIEQMTDLSKTARAKLQLRYEVGLVRYSHFQLSSDGTKKYLFPVSCAHTRSLNAACRGEEDVRLEDGAVEAVMIPDDDRATLCVSSQSGCKMGCRFCMTGRQGFHGNLSAADIISQFISVDESDRLTNAVFMGMGEPLDNYENVMRAIEILTADWGFAWSPKRITLSTIGVTTQLGGRGIVWRGVEYKNVNPLKFFLDNCKVHLAVSLHNPFYEERLALMPAERTFPLEKSLKLIKEYDFTGQRRVSFEYTMFNKVNDSKRHADRLAQLLRGLECRVNLIRFHSIPDSPLESSPMQVIEHFRERLQASGITATIRASRGEDILAACGMLSGKGNNL